MDTVSRQERGCREGPECQETTCLERQLKEAREDEIAQKQISDLWQARAETAERQLAEMRTDLRAEVVKRGGVERQLAEAQAALKQLAKQMTLKELEESGEMGAPDVDGAYDQMINVARAALAAGRT
jgi:hypothetical protein